MAGSNDLFTDVALGKKPIDDESREHFKTKADVVAYVKKSYAALKAEQTRLLHGFTSRMFRKHVLRRR